MTMYIFYRDVRGTAYSRRFDFLGFQKQIWRPDGRGVLGNRSFHISARFIPANPQQMCFCDI